jgi:hypothetical protein
MHYTIQTSFTTLLLTLPLFSQAQKSPLTNETYYLTNCFNGFSRSSYAEIDYYNNKSLAAISDHPSPPDLFAVINSSSSINYEGGTWSSLSGAPFIFTAIIRDDAYTASAGSVIGKANSSSFAGTMECVRLARVVVHMQKEVTCYSDYACMDRS